MYLIIDGSNVILNDLVHKGHAPTDDYDPERWTRGWRWLDRHLALIDTQEVEGIYAIYDTSKQEQTNVALHAHCATEYVANADDRIVELATNLNTMGVDIVVVTNDGELTERCLRVNPQNVGVLSTDAFVETVLTLSGDERYAQDIPEGRSTGVIRMANGRSTEWPTLVDLHIVGDILTEGKANSDGSRYHRFYYGDGSFLSIVDRRTLQDKTEPTRASISQTINALRTTLNVSALPQDAKETLQTQIKSLQKQMDVLPTGDEPPKPEGLAGLNASIRVHEGSGRKVLQATLTLFDPPEDAGEPVPMYIFQRHVHPNYKPRLAVYGLDDGPANGVALVCSQAGNVALVMLALRQGTAILSGTTETNTRTGEAVVASLFIGVAPNGQYTLTSVSGWVYQTETGHLPEDTIPVGLVMEHGGVRVSAGPEDLPVNPLAALEHMATPDDDAEGDGGPPAGADE